MPSWRGIVSNKFVMTSMNFTHQRRLMTKTMNPIEHKSPCEKMENDFYYSLSEDQLNSHPVSRLSYTTHCGVFCIFTGKGTW